MGNCQAIDIATLVIQHPNGKAEKMYWPVSASDVMKMNPGHYVALLISTTTLLPSTTNNNVHNINHSTSISNNNNNSSIDNNNNNNGSTVRLTKIKLLRPTDTLLLGHVYRLIPTQEVMSSLKAKKQTKVNKNQTGQSEDTSTERVEVKGRNIEARKSVMDYQGTRSERTRPKTTTLTTSKPSTNRPRTTWHPSLNSISEANGN